MWSACRLKGRRRSNLGTTRPRDKRDRSVAPCRTRAVRYACVCAGRSQKAIIQSVRSWVGCPLVLVGRQSRNYGARAPFVHTYRHGWKTKQDRHAWMNFLAWHYDNRGMFFVKSGYISRPVVEGENKSRQLQRQLGETSTTCMYTCCRIHSWWHVRPGYRGWAAGRASTPAGLLPSAAQRVHDSAVVGWPPWPRSIIAQQLWVGVKKPGGGAR